MKLSTSLIVSSITLIVGLVFKENLILVPVSVIVASIIDLFTRQWVTSNQLGHLTKISISLKGIFAFIGFYAMIGQFVCIGLLIKWFV